LVFNGLVKYDKNLQIVGDLAESWTVSPDGLVITFHLRRSVTWHDEVPFTAEDVRFTYERLVDPKVRTPYASDFELVKSLEVLDPYTVRVTYKEPFSPGLISWGMGMIPKHVFASGDFNTHPANRRPIGTGPFRFQLWKTDDRILLEANPRYYEGRPYLDRYLYLIIPDQTVQFLELRNEAIDAMTLTPDQFKAYPEFFRRYRKFRYVRPIYTYLGFNLRNPLFQSAAVRRAIAHAIDKQALAQGVLLGFGQPVTGPYPPTSWAFNPNVKEYPYNLETAKTLLASEGWVDHDGDGWVDRNGRPFEFTILTNQGNKSRALTAEMIQDQLKRIGIKVHVRILEWATFLHQYVDPGAFDAVILGWQLSFDPDQYNIWHSSQRKPGRYNFVGYANPEVDRLLEQGRRVFDRAKRQQIYWQLHQRLAEDLPYVFLYAPDTLAVIHRRVRGPEVAPAGLGWNFREWYVPPAEQKYPTHIIYAR
ncbi:MAG: peptide-binding protein, partial [Elusimicrobia bacterium]|nr:peptide-binding protein [Elusimicrobiota bacterium]